MTRRRDVRETYDRIAHHFSKTRQHPWSEVRSFVRGRSAGVALDIGVGNGRHAELLATVADRVVGLDLSRGTLLEARGRASERGFGVELVQADAAGLPLRSNAVDLATYVATVHHLPSRELRIASLDELARVLVPGGRALVSAWSTTHETFDRETGFDTTVDWTLPDGETVGRFYHIYDPGEFESDLAASALTVVETFTSEGNCYGVVEG